MMMNRRIVDKLPFFGLLLISVFPLFNIKGVSISIIILTALSLIYLFSNFKKKWNPDIRKTV